MLKREKEWTSPRELSARDADRAAAIIFWLVAILIVLVAVYGCAPLAERDDPAVTAQLSAAELAECELEGVKASANVPSALEAGFVKLDVERKCRRVKAMQKQEAARETERAYLIAPRAVGR